MPFPLPLPVFYDILHRLTAVTTCISAQPLPIRVISMAYAEQDSIAADMQFKSPSGLTIKTTGNTVFLDADSMYVHEVEIAEGEWTGEKFLFNLDFAEALS